MNNYLPCRTIAVCLLCAVVQLSAGCGRHPRIVPVHGHVTLSGKPVGPGDILFIPNESKGTTGKAAVGYFEEDGRYVLTTNRNEDGAIVGHHTVVIRPRPIGVEPGAEFWGNATLPPIPPRYGDLTNSPLSAEVTPETGEIDFDLTP